MGKEIERKFLVNPKLWDIAEKPAGVFYRQGYILAEAGKTVRVRIAGNAGFLTIKGAAAGISRDEYEYEIPLKDAEEMLDRLCGAEVVKKRYKVICWGKDERFFTTEGPPRRMQRTHTEDPPRRTQRTRIEKKNNLLLREGNNLTTKALSSLREENHLNSKNTESKERAEEESTEGKLWEVDVFEGGNQGLIIAEIELKSEDELFDVPEWIDKEVTGDMRYYNSYLSMYPFKDWR